MISRLTGKILSKQAPQVLLDIAGVGYEVEAPMSTFYHLPAIGEQTTLHTHLIIREDAHLLYGFFSLQERKLFRALIKVNGVGPKLAITILSGLSPDEFVASINANDSQSLVRLPGVGKKTAERLIVEMRDRVGDWAGDEVTPISGGDVLTQSSIVNDAISALVALGYKPQEAERAIKRVQQTNLSSEELIRQALKS